MAEVEELSLSSSRIDMIASILDVQVLHHQLLPNNLSG